MKKKVKLFTSIASLGLALALMTFGVIAATSGSLTVTNSISFNISNEIETSVFGVSSGKTATRPTVATASAGYDTAKLTGDVGDATLTDTWNIGTTTLDVVDDKLVITMRVLNEGTEIGGASLIKVELTYTEDSTNGLTREVFIDDGTTALTESANKVTIMAGDTIANSVGYSEDVEFQVVFTLVNKGASLNDVDCGFTLDLTGVRPAS